MVTPRNPRSINIPYPWVADLSQRAQEQLYEDFLALGRAGTGTRWATIVIAPSDASALSKSTADVVCTGTSDNVLINAAISTLAGARVGTGIGRIVLLEGTFNVTAAIGYSAFGPRQLVIQGMGGAGAIPATRVVATNSAACFSFNGSSTSEGSAVTLMNLGMSNTSSSAATINNRDIALTVQDCRIVNATAGAINIDNGLGTSGASRVVNNVITATGASQGVYADVGSGADSPILISGNIITTGAGGTGVNCNRNLSTVPTYQVTDNYISGNGTGFGIDIGGGSTEDCAVVGNIVRFYATGIRIAGSRHLVASNVVSTCTTGIAAFTGSTVPAILSNQIYNCTTAVDIGTNCTTPSVIGNKFSACTTGTSIGAGTTNAAVFVNDTYGTATPLSDAGTATRTDGTNILSYLTSAVNIDANARVGVRKNSAGSTFKRRRVNLIEGTGITLTVADDSVDEEVDVTIAAATSSGGSTSAAITEVAHGFVVGNLIRYNGINFVKSKADSLVNSQVIGMVSVVTDADHVVLTLIGEVTGLSGLVAGTTYYLDPTTAGTLTATEPSAAGQYSKPLLIASSTTAGYFFNWRGIAAGSSGGGTGTVGTLMFNHLAFR